MTRYINTCTNLEMAAQEFAMVLLQTFESRDEQDQNFKFEVTISRGSSKNLLVEYEIGGYYGENLVKGSGIAAVISEWHRRHGWNETYKPMTLISPPVKKPVKVKDEEPEVPDPSLNQRPRSTDPDDEIPF